MQSLSHPAAPAMLLAFALVFGFVPVATSQSPDAPPLSKDVRILYAHHHDSDTAELNGWMNTLANDTTANDIALGPAGTLAGTRAYTLTLNPAVASGVALDPAGKVKITAYIGSIGGNGAVNVNTTLKSGTQVVADGPAKQHVFQASAAAQYPTVTWDITPAVANLTAGQPLVWFVTLQGAAQDVFLGVHPERGQSNIDLPVISAPPPSAGGTTYHDLTGDDVDISHSLPNATTGTHVYNWTTHHPRVDIAYEATRTGGSVAFSVIDAEDTTLVRGNLSSNSSDSVPAEGAGGQWRITVEFRAYVGEFTLTISDATPPSPTPTNTRATSRTSTATETGTGPDETDATTGTTSEKGKKGGVPFVSPWAVIVVGLASAFVVAARRR